MMGDLERLLNERGIRFHRMGNRIRCFPHVVNIAVQHGLRALGCSSKKPDTDSAIAPLCAGDPVDPILNDDQTSLMLDAHFNDALQNDPEYAAALSENPVKAARTLIMKARQSGQRREEFDNLLNKCLDDGTFIAGEEPAPGTQLLRDVDTRWSSTFLMLDRLLTLYPVVQLLMTKHDPGALLSDKTLDVLSDIREFLAIPHAVQELLSAENTPTASLALPAYAELVDILKAAQSKLPRIAHGLQAAVSALEEYMAYTRQTRVYALAMSKGLWNTLHNTSPY
ncbi:hypothetical protein C8Q77DRAFT_1214245 [Trametes polyzona]|nr:hypothetical protein C8Q77DRAFT_1214245 [Trametes polyzona]